MKRILVGILLVGLIAGCSVTRIDTMSVSGDSCSATSSSIFMSAAELSRSACGGKMNSTGSDGGKLADLTELLRLMK